jgi:hypothetical protein
VAAAIPESPNLMNATLAPELYARTDAPDPAPGIAMATVDPTTVDTVTFCATGLNIKPLTLSPHMAELATDLRWLYDTRIEDV